MMAASSTTDAPAANRDRRVTEAVEGKPLVEARLADRRRPDPPLEIRSRKRTFVDKPPPGLCGLLSPISTLPSQGIHRPFIPVMFRRPMSNQDGVGRQDPKKG